MTVSFRYRKMLLNDGHLANDMVGKYFYNMAHIF